MAWSQWLLRSLRYDYLLSVRENVTGVNTDTTSSFTRQQSHRLITNRLIEDSWLMIAPFRAEKANCEVYSLHDSLTTLSGCDALLSVAG
jgi:hypothetical protein